ncbi:MAG: AMP-binding protein [Flavobacterium sp.]|nr:MAG: AMP-binding protein [Flavobacterium sp.] [Flavobacterium sp. FEMGT703F]
MFDLFSFALKINGFPIEKAQRQLSDILAVPEENYTAFVEQKKREIVDFHLKNNKFYKNFIGEIDTFQWENIPVLKKSDFQIPLEKRLSIGYNKKTVYINSTSGSSGDPMVFAKDKFCHALIWANIMHRFAWHGVDFNHSYQARFYGMPLDFKSNKILRFKDFLSNRYRFNIFDLSASGIEKIITKFKQKKFTYINGYTSSIVLVAKHLKEKKLVLKNLCPSLKICIVTSEMLFEDDKRLLVETLGVPIINEYGASELDVIAFENQTGEWTVNAETLFVEILDENNKPLPLGKEGRIVVTNLYNKAHPFIRYDVGDYGVLDEKSTAKHPILKKLTGRTNDVAVLPSGKMAPGMTFYSITKKLFGDEGNVKEFTITQIQSDTFEIQYASEVALTTDEINRIEKVFTNFLEPNLKYIFNRKNLLQRNKNGKLKQFTSLVKNTP